MKTLTLTSVQPGIFMNLNFQDATFHPSYIIQIQKDDKGFTIDSWIH